MSKALIVDDEVQICKLLKYQLKKQGIESSVTHTISDGVKTFNPGEHKIVFLDINLPDGSGLDCIPILKGRGKVVKIIVISAYDTPEEHRKAFDLGADYFLGKPFSRDMVLQMIKTVQDND